MHEERPTNYPSHLSDLTNVANLACNYSQYLLRTYVSVCHGVGQFLAETSDGVMCVGCVHFIDF